jgi:hypothetical protein
LARGVVATFRCDVDAVAVVAEGLLPALLGGLHDALAAVGQVADGAAAKGDAPNRRSGGSLAQNIREAEKMKKL